MEEGVASVKWNLNVRVGGRGGGWGSYEGGFLRQKQKERQQTAGTQELLDEESLRINLDK